MVRKNHSGVILKEASTFSYLYEKDRSEVYVLDSKGAELMILCTVSSTQRLFLFYF